MEVTQCTIVRGLEMSKNIIAGPWLGEFGWELMRWQGIFRKLSMDGWNVYMIARDGHQELYKDYVKQFIPAESFGFNTKGETDGWRINNEVPSLTMDQRNTICPGAKYVSAAVCMQISKQEFIKYEPEYKLGAYDILIHARSTNKVETKYRNWSEENWNTLCGKLNLDTAFIGSEYGAYANCDYGDDLRGLDLKRLITIMCNSKLIIGPSSGPMHLASLCGTPHVYWTDTKYWGSCGGTNRYRYEVSWNPLGTKSFGIDQFNWQPPVDVVHDEIIKALEWVKQNK